MTPLFRSLIASACLAVCAPTLHAQVDRASMTGTVEDSAGRGVPNALVTATQRATGVRREVHTSSRGTYVLPELPLGLYFVSFAALGFQEKYAHVSS